MGSIEKEWPGFRQGNESVDLYHVLINNLDQGFCVTKVLFNDERTPVNLLFLEVNESFEKQTGFKNAKGRTILDFIPGFEDRLLKQYGEVVITGNPCKIKNQPNNTGSRWFDISVFRIGKQNEDIAGILFNDVSERKKIEEDLHQAKEKTEALIESNDSTKHRNIEKALEEKNKRIYAILQNSRDAIYCMNIQNGRYEYISPSVKSIVGFTAEELTSLDLPISMASMIHPDHIETLREAQQKSYITGEAQAEYLQKSKDGNYRWLSNHMTVVYDEDGKPLYRYGNIRDITAWKQYEEALNESQAALIRKQEQLKKAKKALEKSQKKLRLALENGQIGLWEWNLKSNIITWDIRMQKMFGLTGENEADFSDFKNAIHEDDVQIVLDKLEFSVKKGQPFQSVLRNRSGTNYISVRGLLSRDRLGKPSTMTGVCFDVTEMKKGTEQVLIKLNEELLRSNNDLQQFAYVASHDLQEPLRMVSSFTQLLQQRYQDKLDNDANEYINYAIEGSKRMYSLLNGLLSYSRINTRGGEFTSVKMNEVVRKVQENLRLIITERDAVIECSELPAVNADENQMIQLLQNLIENSLKFSREKPHVTIMSKAGGNHHIISVRDQGIGIDPSYHERIFKIFQRLRPSEYSGTGIGLSVCKRIIDRHGGRIWVESKEGQGSTFSFSIPFH
jgi:PAS domain S-box-containing protein